MGHILIRIRQRLDHHKYLDLIMLKFAIFACLLAYSYALKYTECMANSAIKINKVGLAPYPPNLSEGFTAEYDVDILKNIDGEVDVKLALQKKMGIIWLTIPCTGNVGSCTYNDICTLMDGHVSDELCTILGLFGLPCECPWNAQKFTGSNDIPALDLGSAGALVSGQYKAKAEVISGGEVVACLEAELELKA